MGMAATELTETSATSKESHLQLIARNLEAIEAVGPRSAFCVCICARSNKSALCRARGTCGVLQKSQVRRAASLFAFCAPMLECSFRLSVLLLVWERWKDASACSADQRWRQRQRLRQQLLLQQHLQH